MCRKKYFFSCSICFAVLAVTALLLFPSCSPGDQLILATTTSTQDSGLLDALIPVFERETGYSVKTIAVGSGQALALGERGEADVLFVHSPDAEEEFIAAGHGIDRRLVMHNDFVIVGPSDDPAGIAGLASASQAFARIAQARSLFLSRADDSGTNARELKLWKAASLQPRGSWYQETGQGMGPTLAITNDKRGYTLSDRGTYLALRKNLDLAILLEGDPGLSNIYHVIRVNPEKSQRINAEGARAFADFITSSTAHEIIRNFGVDSVGEPLFFPDAYLESTPSGGPLPEPALP